MESADASAPARCAVALHARPAARAVTAARAFAGEIWFERDGNPANAKSLIAVLALEAGAGADITIHARGPGAAEIVERLRRLVEAEA